MPIIIKFIWNNIKEKKFRTTLILLSVTLSAALFFASVAISGTIEAMYLQRMAKYFGSADIIIHPNEKSPTGFFHTEPAEAKLKQPEYIVGSIEQSAEYQTRQETVTFDLKGFKLPELQQMNPYVLEAERDRQPFQGKKMIISKATADRFHFRAGDRIELKIGFARYRFQIVGIAGPLGLFQEDGRSNTAVVPRETLAALSNAPGRVSVLYIKLQDRSRLRESIALLSETYRRFTVREPVSRQELQQYTSTISTPFMLMVFLVFIMSIFIIYTSFKVITRERLPVIGTFRSIGATQRMTNLVLLAESVSYGVIGGIAGCILGIGILYVMSMLMTPQWLAGMQAPIKFSVAQLLLAFGLAIVLAVISSALPIMKVARIPVKDIILGTTERPRKRKSWQFGLGLLSLILAFVLPLLAPKSYVLAAALTGMGLAIAAVVVLVPYLTKGFIKLFERAYLYIFGNEGILAAKNLRDNQSILNNISLLAIGISSLLMISTISYSVGKEVLNVYRDAQFDIWMGLGGADRSFKPRLASVAGVQDVYGLYSAHNVEIQGRKDKIFWLTGANQNKFFQYWEVNIQGDQRAILAKLDLTRTIMLSTILKDKLGVNVGDDLNLQTRRGPKTYRIIGWFRSLMQNGNFAIISERYLKADFMQRYYSDIFIKTSASPATVERQLQIKFRRERPFIMTMRAMETRNMQSNAQMFLILQGFSLLALVIGIFGVFNNLMISFIERKRSLAVMHSVGMSNRQALKMIFIESITGGIIGGSVGILAGLLLISLVPQVMSALNLPIPIHYDYPEFALALVAGVVITVVASISPALKAAKLNIIESIKYE
jgi:putative ABC transport system permease protein